MKIKEALQDAIEQLGDIEIISCDTESYSIQEPTATELIIKIRYYEQTDQKKSIQNPG